MIQLMLTAFEVGVRFKLLASTPNNVRQGPLQASAGGEVKRCSSSSSMLAAAAAAAAAAAESAAAAAAAALASTLLSLASGLQESRTAASTAT